MSDAIERAIAKYGKEKVEEAMSKLQARLHKDLELDRVKDQDPEAIKSRLSEIIKRRMDAAQVEEPLKTNPEATQ